MGMTASTGRNNDEMVDNLIATRSLKSRKIELVFRLVDRGRFLHPAERTRNGYDDAAYRESHGDPIGYFHLSAPSIYAMVLENLDLQPGMSFLNLGSGTGYFSTMAGFLLGENGTNYGVELYEHLINFAECRAVEMSQSAQTCAFDWSVPHYLHGNAFQICSQRRYDRIYCGAMVPMTRRSFFCDLLNINGVLIMPYGDSLLRIVRRSETLFNIRTISTVTFGSFIQPNPENKGTDCPVIIGGSMPLFLVDICRYVVRTRLRNTVKREGGGPLMRYKIPDEVQRKYKSSKCNSEIEARNRDATNTIASSVSSSNVLAEEDNNNARNSENGSTYNQGQHNRRNTPSSRHITTPPPANRQRIENLQNLIEVLDNRYGRHREAQERITQYGRENVNASGPRRNFLDLQREREQKRAENRQLLDDSEFELIKGFHFERMVGDVAVEDVVDGFVPNPDTDDEEDLADVRRIRQFWDVHDDDDDNEEHRSNRERVLSDSSDLYISDSSSNNNGENDAAGPSSFSCQQQNAARSGRTKLNEVDDFFQNEDMSTSGESSRVQNTSEKKHEVMERGDAVNVRPACTTRHGTRSGSSLVIRIINSTLSPVSRRNEAESGNENVDDLSDIKSKSAYHSSNKLKEDNERKVDSEMMINATNCNGKRSMLPSNSGLNKRVRSDTFVEKDGDLTSKSSRDENCMEQEAEHDTSKILQDGIGHALDEVEEEENNQNDDELKHGENLEDKAGTSFKTITSSNESKSATNLSEDSDLSPRKRKLLFFDFSDASTSTQSGSDKTTSVLLSSETSGGNSSDLKIERSDLSDSHSSSVAARSNDSRIEDNVRARVRGDRVRQALFSSILSMRIARNAERETSNDRAGPSSSDESMNSSVQESKPTTKPSETDTDESFDSDAAERDTAVYLQTTSLEDFRRKFEALIDKLPLTARMIEFLKYE